MKRTSESAVRTGAADGRIKARVVGATAIALSMSCGMAHASDAAVQLFGIIDIGVLSQSKAGNGKSNTQMATSGLRQSVWGFRGTEDLGNGLKAFFNLESHFDTNNGELHPTGDAPGHGVILFRRQANVGLSGNWGSLTLGRQYGPALLAHIGTEPRAFKEQFSNLYAWAYDQLLPTIGATTDRNTNNDVGIFFNNAIQYRNTFGPVTVGVLYALGGVPGSFKKNSVYALGATYNGPVTVSGSYEEMFDQSTGDPLVKHGGLGFAVPFNAFTFKFNYLNAKNYSTVTGTEVSKVDAYGLGMDWKWHPSNSMTIAYYNNKDKINRDDETKNWVISNDYSFSKRTTLYAQLAYVDAKPGATIRTSIVAAGVPQQGAKTTLLNVGLNHTW
jgi:predicted porin